MDSIVKAELRARIQLQRLLSGQEELAVNFLPSPTYELTLEDKIKIEKRRQNNRKSALKSRRKKRELEDRLKQKYDLLYSKNARLQKEIQDLQMQVTALQHKLKTHICPVHTVDTELKEVLIMHSQSGQLVNHKHLNNEECLHDQHQMMLHLQKTDKDQLEHQESEQGQEHHHLELEYSINIDDVLNDISSFNVCKVWERDIA